MNKYLSLTVLVFALSLLFEGHVFDDNDYRFDRPTREAYSHFSPPVNYPDVVTVNGYDNFDAGVDFYEQHLSHNPLNPLQMFFATNFTALLNARFTLDGHDWTLNNPAYPAGTCCDPWSSYDRNGNLFYSVLVSTGTTGNWVTKSTNNGQTWGPFVLAISGGDRNSIAADQTNGPYSNYIYATVWAPGAGFARSTDGGLTWTTTATGSNTTPGNIIAVGPNGSTNGGCVYWVTITGSNPAPSTFNIWRSTNGGANLTIVNSSIQPGYVGTLNSVSRLVINNARTRPYPWIAADQSSGPYRGRLYVVYASNVPAGNGNKPDIKLQYSTDQGATFSAPVIVNDNANPAISDQWFPAIWCETTTGRLYITWYDTRNNPGGYGCDIYGTYSTDGGVSFAQNQRLTNATWGFPNPACSPNTNCYRGDYHATTANPLTSFTVWGDHRNGTALNMGAYFPDFAMTVNPSTINIGAINDSAFGFVSVPSVKLYTAAARFSATISPPPLPGSITITFLSRSSNAVQDSILTFPDSVRMRVTTTTASAPVTYTITVQGNGYNGTPVHRRTVTLNVGLTGIVTQNEIPDRFYLYQNYPNPFNASSKFKVQSSKLVPARVILYDISGRKVMFLVNETLQPGIHEFDIDAGELPSGVYFYKIQAGDYTAVRKLVLIK